MNYQIYLLKARHLLLVICAATFSLLTTAEASVISETIVKRMPVADFDGDGKADISVFRPSNGFWHIKKSSGGFLSFQWGMANDKLVPGDYDGDGKTDAAVHRKLLPFPETGTWYILKSLDFTYISRRWASNNIGEFDIPVPADYDGDGKTDLAYYRVTDVVGQPATYFVLQSLTNTGTSENWGSPSLGDRPVPADYDGDGRADYAVYRNGVWFILQTSNAALRVERFGLATDKVVPGDFDGDKKADIAVWRPSNGFWYLLLSSDNSIKYIQFGLSDDKPTPDDYDGDGKTDVAVFRPSNGIWYQQLSSSGFRVEYFGLSTDIPIQNVFVR
ncbi:MAG: FG-GAP repeat domain-containing protein [Pyrinomonadaceae bacterium]